MSPKARQIVYYIGTLVPGLLGLALIFGGIEAGAAENLEAIVAGFLNLLGASAPATAAVKVRQQRKDGTLTGSPAEQVTRGVEQVIEAKRAAEEEVARVRQVFDTAIGGVPVLGPRVSQLIGDAWQAYSESFDHNTAPWNR